MVTQFGEIIEFNYDTSEYLNKTSVSEYMS